MHWYQTYSHNSGRQIWARATRIYPTFGGSRFQKPRKKNQVPYTYSEVDYSVDVNVDTSSPIPYL
jgi:hypothetical protein